MADDLYAECTTECERMPSCTVCDRTKAPRGRSVPLECGASFCDWGCPGYVAKPTPGHLWPGELARIREDDDG